MLNKLTPNLMVDSVEKAIEFYEGVLGFTVVHKVPGDDALNFAILHLGNVELMLQSRASMAEDVPKVAEVPLGAASLVLYTDVEDVEGMHQRLDGKVDVVLPMRKTFYGMQEFYVRDPFGFFWGFAQKAE